MISLRFILAGLVAGWCSCAVGQEYIAGYVDVPANYISDPSIRGAFEKALNGKVQWEAFATEDALAEAMASGKIQVGVGQTISGWLDGIEKGQPTLALGLSRTEAVPCFVGNGTLDRIKSNEKKEITLELGGDWAKDNVLQQLNLAGIDASKVRFIQKDFFDPTFEPADIDCIPGRFGGNAFQPLLSDSQRADLAVASTALVTAVPNTEVNLKDFLMADDAAKMLAATRWTFDGKAASIVLPSIRDQNIDYAGGMGILQKVKDYSSPTDASAAAQYVDPGLLIELGSGIRAVKLLFGTDRQWSPSTVAKVLPATNRAESLSFGSLLISVPVNHKRGKIERPFEIPVMRVRLQAEDPQYHFTIQDIGPLSEDDFAHQVSSLAARPGDFSGRALVFVHGYNSPFEDAAYRLAQIVYDMNFDGVPILYSWPSKGDPVQYVADYTAAENAAFYFSHFLRTVAESTGVKQLDVICHSMGCRTVLEGLELSVDSQGEPSAPKAAPLKELIIASPDVDAVVFRRSLERLAAAGYGMTLYASAADVALGLSKDVAGGYPRAGDLIDGEPLVFQPLQSIDVTSLGDSFDLQHSEYADEPVLMHDVAELLLRGTRPPTERTRFNKLMSKAGSEYWRY